jgi:acetyltransferase
MSIHNLDKIFKPNSVAVIGASSKEGSMGYFLIRSLTEAGFSGEIYPVNPSYKTIEGRACYASIRDIPHPVDLAIIAIPIDNIPNEIRQCGDKKVGGAILISAGGKEIGDQGRHLELGIKKEADLSGIRIIGPNCMGIACTDCNLNASFTGLMPPPGRLAFVSQSGAMCSSILDIALKQSIGFRYFVSIGSMLDVDFGDMINYLGNDPQVSSIVLYIENLTHIRKFMSAARAVSRTKPIMVLKAGKSMAGARAAASHTGALAGEDAVYSAAFSRSGIVRVNTIEELFDCAELISKRPPPSGSGLAILSNGGGPGVMAADALSDRGLEPVSLNPDTLKKLDQCLPTCWSKSNPIDILGDASPQRWKMALEACIAAPEIKSLVIIFVPQTASHAVAVAEIIKELFKERRYPIIFTVWMGGKTVEEGRRILYDAGIPTYETPERAISAVSFLVAYAKNLEMLQEIPPKLPVALEFDRDQARKIISEAPQDADTTFLTEKESKDLLAAYGIPVNQTGVAGSADEAVLLAQTITYPVAMKIHSRDIVHKSDAHGVKLGLRNDKEVRDAFSKIMEDAFAYNQEAELHGVTVQKMLSRPDYELLLGSKVDKDFGPVILFGMGGIMTEILRDQAIGLPPLNRLLARRLIENTRVYNILKGYRNHPPARLDLLEEILIRLSQLVTDFPEISELDINPMILIGDQTISVDARVILRKTPFSSPHHLVISPYPNEYETTVITKTGLSLFIP